MTVIYATLTTVNYVASVLTVLFNLHLTSLLCVQSLKITTHHTKIEKIIYRLRSNKTINVAN